MESGQGTPRLSRLGRFFLHCGVHIDAFRLAPGAYLQGVWWRACRLKLRSRHRFSSLKGHSPRAYDLWKATREYDRHADLRAAPRGSGQQFMIVIDCRGSSTGLPDTLRSIDAAIALAGDDAALTTRVTVLGEAGHGSVPHPGLLYANDGTALRDEVSRWLGGMPQSGHWLMAVAAGDRLAPECLIAYRAAIMADPVARLFYADDDLVDPTGRRHTPHFKPQWNAELAGHHDFVSHSSILSADPKLIGEDWPGGAMAAQQPRAHVPYVLHHRLARPDPVVPAAMPEGGNLPHVSIIIPTRDHADLLRQCIAGLRETDYPSFDITVIDNGSVEPDALSLLAELAASGVRIVTHAGPFNYAAMHNAVVPDVRGPVLCLLNNDIEVIDPQWLRHMARQVMAEDVGAVGARLLYPDRSIQHAGIIIGMGGGAGHSHRHQAAGSHGYFRRADLPQYVSAVTAACLLVKATHFEAVGGFDEDNFAVAFNDVDLCLKLNAKGWQSFYEPRAVLIHHESKSRGKDREKRKKARFAGELAALKRIWHTDRCVDPYHHPELSRLSEQFVVRL